MLNFLQHEKDKDNLSISSWLNWIEISTYRFCDCDLNEIVLLLQKGSYTYEYLIIGEIFLKNVC